MSKVNIRPGYVVLDTSSAHGGVHYYRKEIEAHAINNGEGVDATHETRKVVDHVAAVKAVDAVTKELDYAIRKYCAKTVFGPFCSDEDLPALQARVEELRAKADQVNADAAAAGSARRAYIGIVPVRIDVVSPEAAREIARTVCDVLSELRDAVKDGDVGPRFDGIWLKARNLAKLATGLQSECICWALDEINANRKECKDRIKRGSDPATAGKDLDFSQTEGAIASFTVTVADSNTATEDAPVES